MNTTEQTGYRAVLNALEVMLAEGQRSVEHGYALGVAQGRIDARARYEPRPPLSDDRVKWVAESMPGGIEGFLKGWGWQQFARAIEAEHGIGTSEVSDD